MAWGAFLGSVASGFLSGGSGGASGGSGSGGGMLGISSSEEQDFFQDNKFGENRGGGIGSSPINEASGAGHRGIVQTFAFGRGTATSRADASGGGSASGSLNWIQLLAVGGFALLALLIMRGMVKGK